MNAQPEPSQTDVISLPTLQDSDDSDAETSLEEESIMGWNDLSIIERVGLNSLEMSENDVEAAFSQITLAFRCDQYTLKQRLQAEEHARNLAEENVQLELARGKETLEMLKALCLDSRRSTILQKLELSLDILGGTVERISNTAEVLGAVHQEARVSRAVDLMVSHVENLRRRYQRNLSELEEARRQITLRTSHRNPCSRDSDPEENENDRKLIRQGSLRRRVSLTIITNPTLEKRKRERKRGGKKSSSTCPSPCPSPESSVCALNDTSPPEDRDPDAHQTPENLEPSERRPEPPPAPAACPSEAPAGPKPEEPLVKPEPSAPHKNSTFETVRQRHKGRAGSSRKRSERKSPHRRHTPSAERCGPPCKGPGTRGATRCRWALLCLCLSVSVSLIITVYWFMTPHEGDGLF